MSTAENKFNQKYTFSITNNEQAIDKTYLTTIKKKKKKQKLFREHHYLIFVCQFTIFRVVLSIYIRFISDESSDEQLKERKKIIIVQETMRGNNLIFTWIPKKARINCIKSNFTALEGIFYAEYKISTLLSWKK